MKQFPNDTEAIEAFFKIMKVLVSTFGSSSGETFRVSLNVPYVPAARSQEDAVPGHSEADAPVAGLVPAQVRHRSPLLLRLPPCRHQCNRLCRHPDQKHGSSTYLFLFFLWWVHINGTLLGNRWVTPCKWSVCLGVPPRDSSIVINALLLQHYKRGAYYPLGGASEIPFHIIRTIRKYGGTCLVRAPVSQVLVNGKGEAYGKKRLKARRSRDEAD